MAKDDPFADIYAADKPDPNNPFAGIYTTPPTTAQWLGKQALDVAKQIPTGLALGVEAIPAFPAKAMGFVGKYLPAGKPEVEEQQAKMRELAAGARGEGLAGYLPKPETRLGAVARTAAEFVPSVVGGGPGSIPRLAGVGATTGAASEVAGQATEGTAAEPWARVGTALVAGPAAMRASERAVSTAAAKQLAKDIEPRTSAMYDQFRNSGFELTPQAAPTFATGLAADLRQAGMTPVTAERTYRVLDDFITQPWRTPTEFQAAYKQLGSVARSAKDGEERLAASIAQERLLGFLENVPPQMVTGTMRVAPSGAVMPPAATADEAVGLLREANANWAAAKRAELLSGKITKAEMTAAGQYSGLGLENELRRRISAIADPTARGPGKGFTPEELERFKAFGEGTKLQNIRRYATGLLGGRGGIATTVIGGGGLGIGSYLTGGDPTLAATAGIGAPLAGLGLAMRGNAAALARARGLERDVLFRAPMAAGYRPQPGGLPPLPMSLRTAPATLATMGEY